MSGDAHGGGHLPQRISPVLVGREAEFAALRDACRSAPSIAVVGGEAGIGKSRLVAEVVTSDGRGVVMVGYCEPVQEPFPLGPVLDAIRSAADRLPPPADLSPVVGALAPYLPEIAPGLPPALAPLGDLEAERHRLFRAVAALLDNVGSVVLVLEDVHWAAASTSDFIAYLATHLPSGLVLMLTVRDEEREVLPIWEALARTRFGPAIQVGLQPLPPSEVGQLARCILGTDSLPQRFVATLAEKTAGIPFVVEEALGMLAAQAESAAAADQTAALTDLAVPAALKDMLLQRLVSLDEHAREVVGAAAVLGVAPDERVLASVVGCGPEELAHPMSQALSVGLLYEDSGRCRFRHPLAQRAVYESLALPTRQLLHRTAAGVLHAEAGPPPVATLAHHYRLAGMEAEFVQNAEAAAALAVSHGDDATAARFLLQAMEADGLSIDDRVRLAGKLGPAAVQGLAQSAALPVLEGLLADSRLPGSSRGRLRFMLGRLLRQQGEAERGYAEIEASLDDLVEVPKQHARALAILAVPLVTAPHLREHLAHCDKAEEVARRSGDTRTDLAVRIARASLRLEIGDPGGWSTVQDLARDPD
ncbi:MAG: ATP-binding protein, partial [Nocardioidaceae bacterium]